MSTISLPDDVDSWARAEVEAGRASSVEAFVAGVMRERRAIDSELESLLAEGRADAMAGRVASGDKVVADLRAWAARLRSDD